MLNSYFKNIEIRWADLDPNFHVLHSKYYDFGAYCRMAFLTVHGVTVALMQQYHVGPIIFREECLFKREIKFGDDITINVMIDKITEDHRKWSLVHEIWINKETLAAIINIDGAWMNTQLRKTTIPPEVFMHCFDEVPKTATFSIIKKA